MLKLLLPESNNFHNLKCAEIFCLTSTIYKAACCLCGKDIEFEYFPQHFQKEHLTSTNKLKDDVINYQNQNQTIKSDQLHVKNESSEVNFMYEDEHNTVQCLAEEDTQDEKPINIEELLMEEDSVEFEDNYEMEPVATLDDVRNDSWENDFISEHTSDSDDLKSSMDGQPYQCKQCARRYKHKRSLCNHMRIHHNPSRPRSIPKWKYKCNECGESFRTQRNLNGHKWKHTGIFCDICGKTFTQTGNLMRHKIRHTGIKAHKCEECGTSFFTDKELRSHMMRHTGFMPVICEICGRKCRDRGVLKAHMRRHTGERPAKCNVCGKSFFSFHDLNVHAVTHSKERPFVCDVCGSTFQRKKALRVHKKIHLKERKYNCKICDKSYVQLAGLKIHMRSHGTALSNNIKSANSAPNITLTIPVEISTIEIAD